MLLSSRAVALQGFCFFHYGIVSSSGPYSANRAVKRPIAGPPGPHSLLACFPSRRCFPQRLGISLVPPPPSDILSLSGRPVLRLLQCFPFPSRTFDITPVTSVAPDVAEQASPCCSHQVSLCCSVAPVALCWEFGVGPACVLTRMYLDRPEQLGG